jgi:uncharacterized repeat protein (TIGR01451 family)
VPHTNNPFAQGKLTNVLLLIVAMLFLPITVALLHDSRALAVGPTISCTTDENLFNTAYNGSDSTLPPGSRDTHWEVGTGNSSGPNSVPFWEQAYVVGKIEGLWANPFTDANWIAQNATADNGGPNIDAYFRYDFDLANEVLLNNFSLKMDFYADNSVPEVWVNGIPQSGKIAGLPQSTNPYFYGGFQPGNQASLTLPFDWKHGQNEIIVRVASGPPETGFMAEFRDESLCANPQYTATKTANPISGSTVYPGNTITYTIAVKNTGSVDFNNLTFNDDLSDILSSSTLVQEPTVSPTSVGTATITNNTLVFQGNLPVGQSATITYAVKVNPDARPGDILRNEVIGTSSNCTNSEQDSTCTTEHTIGEILPATGQNIYTWILSTVIVTIAAVTVSYHRSKSRLL